MKMERIFVQILFAITFLGSGIVFLSHLEIITHHSSAKRIGYPQELRRGLENRSTPTPSKDIPNVIDKVTKVMNFCSKRKGEVTIYGQPPASQKFLTVGLASVGRKANKTYLFDTIDNIINRTSEDEMKQIVVLVFLADMNQTYNQQTREKIETEYRTLVANGSILTMTASPSVYPKLRNLKKNFNDTSERVSWRAKQNIDFAVLFRQAKSFSQYYIHIEDDLEIADQWLAKIRTFIQLVDHLKHPWVVLRFSSLGFIGKLMRSDDLDKFATFLVTFYDEQPADWLLDNFERTMAQKRSITRNQSLFQHIGDVSSLALKRERRVQDKTFLLDQNPGAPVFSQEIWKMPESKRNFFKRQPKFTAKPSGDSGFTIRGLLQPIEADLL